MFSGIKRTVLIALVGVSLTGCSPLEKALGKPFEYVVKDEKTAMRGDTLFQQYVLDYNLGPDLYVLTKT